MVNGTYICDKHANIIAWASRIHRLATVGLEAWESGDALAEIADLATDILGETEAARLDGQKMEDRLVERAQQGDALVLLSKNLKNLATALENTVPKSTPRWAKNLPKPL